MIPDRAVSPVSVLKEIGRMQCFFSVFFVLFRISACRRIDLFQLADRKRRFFRILSLKTFVKIRELRLTFLELRNDQTHLVSPVSEMYIPDHLISFETDDTFNTLTDDRRAQVPHMERLCHIRAAVVDHNSPGVLLILNPQLRLSCHLIQIRRRALGRKLQIDKSRFHHIHSLKINTVLQIFRDIFRNHERRFLIFLRPRHGAVALVFAQVRTVGESHLRKLFVISRLCKRFSHIYCDQFQQCFQFIPHSFNPYECYSTM